MSFIFWSLMPMSENLPDSAPAPAPTAAPSSGFRKSMPIRAPHIPPPAAPAIGQVDGLVEHYIAVGPLGHDNDVFHLQQVVGLHLHQRGAHLKCGRFVIESHNDQV
jgi:hypothetical protein